jgi:predicted  nucleic acid-binding Zn-ribbon protein
MLPALPSAVRLEESMAESKTFLGEEIDRLRELRDELRVQAELGRAELRDRWQDLEKSWHQLEGRLKLARESAREDSQNVREAARLLASELRESYEHLRKRL